MTFHINPKGRNWGSLVNWDDLGKLYAGFAISWTIILYAGAIWLFVNRKLSFLKMRNIPLSIAAISFLHVYLVKILLAYTTNGHFLCSAEFWIMSIYLPFGIALFQASVVQLQSISDQQQRLLESDGSLKSRRRIRHPMSFKGLISRWQTLTALHKTYVLIGLGMLAQVTATAAIYGTSGKLQGHWPAKLTHAKGQAKCRKGLEWIPSSIWQLWWSCFYGPYLLYRVRRIKDVHYWRLQVALSVVAGIPGSPLWLAALYSPAFKPVNKYFVPPMWLAPGIIVMQAVTIFIPIYEAYVSRSNLRTTLELIKTWEEKHANDASTVNSASASTTNSSARRQSYFSSSTRSLTTPTTPTAPPSFRSREMHTMAALEKALLMNPQPLLHFAATKDFTGENIIFLMAVREWRSTWTSMHRTDDNQLTEDATAQMFENALQIYLNCVHEKTADFPINIESRIKRQLDAVFADVAAARRPYRDDNTNIHRNVDVDPFTDNTIHDPFSQPVPSSPRQPSLQLSLPRPVRSIPSRANSDETDTTLRNDDDHQGIGSREYIPMVLQASPEKAAVTSPSMFAPNPSVRLPLKPPAFLQAMAAGTGIAGFDAHVFDQAEKSVKYLVLTNTWQKFVAEHRNAVSP